MSKSLTYAISFDWLDGSFAPYSQALFVHHAKRPLNREVSDRLHVFVKENVNEWIMLHAAKWFLRVNPHEQCYFNISECWHEDVALSYSAAGAGPFSCCYKVTHTPGLLVFEFDREHCVAASGTTVLHEPKPILGQRFVVQHTTGVEPRIHTSVLRETDWDMDEKNQVRDCDLKIE